jgi:hypothetical protein
VKSEKAAPKDGYIASESQTVRVIELTIEPVTIVVAQASITSKVKLEGETRVVAP